jgi:hypothetical protein
VELVVLTFFLQHEGPNKDAINPAFREVLESVCGLDSANAPNLVALDFCPSDDRWPGPWDNRVQGPFQRNSRVFYSLSEGFWSPLLVCLNDDLSRLRWCTDNHAEVATYTIVPRQLCHLLAR